MKNILFEWVRRVEYGDLNFVRIPDSQKSTQFKVILMMDIDANKFEAL